MPTWTTGGNRQRPSYQALVNMVAEGLRAISRPSLIRGAFTACGLAVDGSLALSTNFEHLNYQLQAALHPDAANTSHEIICHMSRVINDDAPITIDDIFFDSTAATSSTPRANRRVLYRRRLSLLSPQSNDD